MKITKKLTELNRDTMKWELYNNLYNLFNSNLFNFQKKYGVLEGDTDFENDVDSKIGELSDLGAKIIEEQLSYPNSKMSIKSILEFVLVKKFSFNKYKNYLFLNDSTCYDDFVRNVEENEICINDDGKFELKDSNDCFFINYYDADKINLSLFADKSVIIYNIPDGAEIEISKEETSKIKGLYGADINNLTIKSFNMIGLFSCDIKELKLVGCSFNDKQKTEYLYDSNVNIK